MERITNETKKRAVREHTQDGRTLNNLAAEYGISKAIVSNWVHAYRKECQANDSEKSQLELLEEVRNLLQKKAELVIVCQNIKTIYHELSGIVGHRAMRVFLERKGISLSKATTHKYMNKELHLHCVCRRKRPGHKKAHTHKVFSNLLQQIFLQQNRIRSGVRILLTSISQTEQSALTARLLICMIAAS